MNQKVIVSKKLSVILIVIVLFLFVFLFQKKTQILNLSKSDIIEESGSVDFPNKSSTSSKALIKTDLDPEVKYQIFKSGLQSNKIIDSVYFYNVNVLPSEVRLDDYVFSLKNIEIEKSTINGFSVYAFVYSPDQLHKIGFWHPDDPTKNMYSKSNGCSKGGTIYDNVCGGVMSYVVEDGEREPTVKEKEQGVLSVKFEKRIFISELDYDFKSNTWNYIELSLGLYEDKQVGSSID